MRVLIHSLIGLAVAAGLTALPAYAADSADSQATATDNGSQQPMPPEQLARQTVNTLLEKMQGRREELRQNPKELYALVNDTLVPLIDVDYMAQLVLGRPWRNATDEQRQRFIRAFKVMIVRTYGNALLEFDKETIDYQPLRAPEDADDVTMRALVNTESGDRVPVSLDLHLVDGQWKVYNGSVGSLSFVTNYRGQFRQAVQQGGLEQLIDRLEKRYNISGKPLSDNGNS